MTKKTKRISVRGRDRNLRKNGKSVIEETATSEWFPVSFFNIRNKKYIIPNAERREMNCPPNMNISFFVKNNEKTRPAAPSRKGKNGGTTKLEKSSEKIFSDKIAYL